MCSNYRPANDKTVLRQHFGVELDDGMTWPPETWPIYQAPVVRRADSIEHSRQVFLGQFGLIPHWGKDPTLAKRTYNARSETAHEKPSFRDAWRKGQRCIIPAEAFFEPKWENGKAARWQISRADGAPLGIAGLWSRWWASNGAEVMTFTMLTINANEHPLMQQFHKSEDEKRMVVVLDETDYDAWLDCPPDRMMSMMTPFPAEQLAAQAAPMPPKAGSVK